MLSTAYVAKGNSTDAMLFLTIALLLLVLDIAVMVYAFYCLIDCTRADSMNTVVAVLLGFLMFSPGAGFLVQVGVIIYHSIYCSKKKQEAPVAFRH